MLAGGPIRRYELTTKMKWWAEEDKVRLVFIGEGVVTGEHEGEPSADLTLDQKTWSMIVISMREHIEGES
jgi:hypothetical protein